MIRHFLLLLTLLSSLQWLQAQPATARVQVLDARTRQPLAGVTATHQQYRQAATDSGLLELEAGLSWTLTSTGYQPLQLIPQAHSHLQQVWMQPMPQELQDVVVSGTLRPMRRLESPIPVESYTTAFLRQNPTPSLFEAMTQVNGIQPQLTCNVCNTGDIRINGMEGPYTMVLIDGMPIVSSLSTVYGLSGIPNSIIKRIEVVKGPASTLYGSEAVGGLINIITKDPLTAAAFSADINATSLGEYNIDLSARLKAGKATGLLGLNGFFFNRPGDINRDNFTDLTLQNRVSLFNKWDWERRNNLPASLAVRLLTERRWGGELQWNRSFLGGDSVYGESIDTRRMEMIGQYGLRKNMLVEYSYNYHWQDSYYGTTWYKGQQHTAFAQLRWNKTIGKHTLLAGIPFRYLWYDDNTPATNKASGNAPSIQTMKALYVQDEISWTPKLTTLAGLRYEYTNLQGGVLAPRLALKWQPAEHHTLRLSGGNGFRIVNLFTEDHAALSGFREIVIKNDLKPERSWNANLNYSGDLHLNTGVLTWDASAFYTWFTNKIIPDYDTDPNKIIYDNLQGYAVSQGLSGQLTLTLRNGLRAMAGFTFMDVYVEENGQRTQQVYAPRWSGNYTLSYTLRKARLSFDLTGRWNGPMRLPVVPDDFRPEYSPWYNLVNLQATKKWNNRWETYLAIKNLLNFIPENPILHPDDPFDRPGGKYWNADASPNAVTNPNGYTFDPSYNYAPMQGIKLMVGLRFSL
ncbi:MAG: TonB-dependent receptor [Chitinophagaceae bacterium]|nr:TonB-dependent receptor [Chitinophagaceae bacterium]